MQSSYSLSLMLRAYLDRNLPILSQSKSCAHCERGSACAQMEVHGSEEALLDALVGAVRALDPDILVGYEVQQGSLGYLNDRATTLARPEPLLRQLSRTPTVTAPPNICYFMMASCVHAVLSADAWLLGPLKALSLIFDGILNQGSNDARMSCLLIWMHF